jgi:hypothetical protein
MTDTYIADLTTTIWSSTIYAGLSVDGSTPVTGLIPGNMYMMTSYGSYLYDHIPVTATCNLFKTYNWLPPYPATEYSPCGLPINWGFGSYTREGESTINLITVEIFETSYKNEWLKHMDIMPDYSARVYFIAGSSMNVMCGTTTWPDGIGETHYTSGQITISIYLAGIMGQRRSGSRIIWLD